MWPKTWPSRAERVGWCTQKPAIDSVHVCHGQTLDEFNHVFLRWSWKHQEGRIVTGWPYPMNPGGFRFLGVAQGRCMLWGKIPKNGWFKGTHGYPHLWNPPLLTYTRARMTWTRRKSISLAQKLAGSCTIALGTGVDDFWDVIWCSSQWTTG